jgi:tripeptide aminopeptidase
MAIQPMPPSPHLTPPEAPSFSQQEIAELASTAQVQAALQWFSRDESRFTRWQLELARIPAPPFAEGARAAWLSQQFEALGLEDVQRDQVGNVLGLRRGRKPAAISVSAHIDTVFPAGTLLDIRQLGPKLYGPGISDNAAGMAAMLAVAAACREFDLLHDRSLLFIGNVGEEGEGDLRGMRHIFLASAWKDSIEASVVIDGAGCDTIVAEALGSRRFEIVIRGPGGHSWSDFGTANPIAALAQAIHLFSQTRVPANPKTIFNIGVIEGGTSVNSIPESAKMRVDIRSTSAMEIERMEQELRRAIELAVEMEEMRSRRTHSTQHDSSLTAEIHPIGNRPAGDVPRNARIVQVALAVDAYLGNVAKIQRASTDANIPISLGREAIAIGAGGAGGGAHTVQEWFDINGRELALKRILLMVLALAGSAASPAAEAR